MQLVHSGNLAFELRLSGSQRAVKVGTFLRSEEGNRLRRGLAKLCLEVEDAVDAQEDKPWVRLEVGSEASGTPRAGRSFSVPEAWAKLFKPDGNSGAARVPTSPMRTPRAEDVAEEPRRRRRLRPVGGRLPKKHLPKRFHSRIAWSVLLELGVMQAGSCEGKSKRSLRNNPWLCDPATTWC